MNRGTVAWVVGAATLAVLLGPFFLEVATGDTDPSWMDALHKAFGLRLVWGRDLIWTYGPWGFAWNGVYWPETFAWSLLLRGALALTLWATIWRLGSKLTLPQRCGWAAAVLLVLPTFTIDGTLYIAAVALWQLDSRGRDRSAVLALGAVLAWFALGKFTLFVCLTAVALLAAARDRASGRRPALLLVWVAATIAGWLAAGQPMSAFVDWLTTSLDLARGFADGMAIRGSLIDPITLSLALGALFLAHETLPLRARRPRLVRALDLTIPAAIVLVTLRHSFTRHDPGHALHGVRLTLGVAVLLAPALSGRRTWRRLVPLGAALLAIATALFLYREDPLIHPNIARLQRLGPRIETMAALVTRDPGPFERVARQRTERVPHQPLADCAGSVDIVPFAQTLLFDRSADWRTRPVLQSYQAYTPASQAANAAFLRGPGAPDCVYFDVRPLDDHHPAERDAQLWLALLERYDVRDVLGTHLLLVRRPQPRELTWTRVGEVTARTGEDVELPAVSGRDLLWVRGTVRESWWTGVLDALLGGPKLLVTTTMDDGIPRTHSVSPRDLQSGLIVSPWLGHRHGFAGVLSAEAVQRRPTALRWSFDTDRDATLELELLTIELGAQPGLRIPQGLGQLVDLTAHRDEYHPLLRDTDGLLHFAHAPSELAGAMPAGATEARVTYGVRDGAADSDRPTDGVHFVALARTDESDDGVELWRARVDPGDLGPHVAQIPLPPGPRRELVLRAEPGDHADSDWSYWRGLRFSR